MVSKPVVQGFNQLVNNNSQALYSAAVDYLAYRIAWHMFQLEQAALAKSRVESPDDLDRTMGSGSIGATYSR